MIIFTNFKLCLILFFTFHSVLFLILPICNTFLHKVVGNNFLVVEVIHSSIRMDTGYK